MAIQACLGRLTKDKEFDRVFKAGVSSYDKLLGIRCIKNDLGTTRLGLIISTKISKKAVVRNKLRRQIREFLRKNIDKLKPGYDVAVIALPGILKADLDTIKQSIIFHLQKLGVSKLARR